MTAYFFCCVLAIFAGILVDHGQYGTAVTLALISLVVAIMGRDE